MKKYNVAVVGVGAVGEEMLRVLRQRNFPINELRVFARSAREIIVDNQKYSVQRIKPDGFQGVDIALFAGTEGEKGIDISDLQSNGLNDVPLGEIGMVVSMTGFPAREYLPLTYTGTVIDWDIDGPIGRSLSTFHRVRDEIQTKVLDLLEQIRRANFSSSK